MTLLQLALRSLRQHLLSTTITIGSIALAGGLVLSIWSLKDQSRAAFAQADMGFDAVLGTRASKLQLVLNSVYHVDSSPGNISWSDYETLRRDPGVAAAIPIATGDSYRGFRIVGVAPEWFDGYEYKPGQSFGIPAPGRAFDPTRREAVLGSFAAARLGLKPGDRFHPAHGLLHDPDKHHHEDEFLVVGVMAPSNTPADRVIWIPISAMQHMDGHDPDTAGEISAVLVRMNDTSSGFRIANRYNREDSRLTLAWPVAEIVARLFDRIGWFDRVLGLVAGLVALVAAGSVVASLYNSMNERRRDLAILRALGAHRRTLLGVILLESAAIGAAGCLLAVAVHTAILAAAAAQLRAGTGVVIQILAWHPVFLWMPAALVGLCIAGGLIPAWKAYQTPVAENLAPVS